MRFSIFVVAILVPVATAQEPAVPVDLTGVRPGAVAVARSGNALVVTWPDETSRVWRATFSLDRTQPIITSIGADGAPVIRGSRPFYHGETGKRRGGWDAFFDDPTSHPDGTRHVQSAFTLRAATARTVGDRVEVRPQEIPVASEGERLDTGAGCCVGRRGERRVRQSVLAAVEGFEIAWA